MHRLDIKSTTIIIDLLYRKVIYFISLTYFEAKIHTLKLKTATSSFFKASNINYLQTYYKSFCIFKFKLDYCIFFKYHFKLFIFFYYFQFELLNKIFYLQYLSNSIKSFTETPFFHSTTALTKLALKVVYRLLLILNPFLLL